MRIWNGQVEDIQDIIQLCQGSEINVTDDYVVSYLAPAEAVEGIYLVAEDGPPLIACWVQNWRNHAYRINHIISSISDQKAEYEFYLQQFFQMITSKFAFADRPLYCFSESEYALKTALRVGFELYDELLLYEKKGLELSEILGLPVDIRLYSADDLDQLIELEQSIFMPEFWNDRDTFHYMANHPDGQILIASMWDQVVGYVYSRVLYDGRGHLVRLGVHSDYQGLGVGRQLLKAGIDWLATNGVDTSIIYVLQRNDRARKLCEGFGFQNIGKEFMIHYAEGEK